MPLETPAMNGTAQEEHARHLGVLAADISWWRVTAKESGHDVLRRRALELAAALEHVRDHWKRATVSHD